MKLNAGTSLTDAHANLPARLRLCASGLQSVRALRVSGRVAGVVGTSARIEGILGHLAIGTQVDLESRDGGVVRGEVVGFQGGHAVVSTYTSPDGIGPGCQVHRVGPAAGLAVDDSWLGRVIDPLGRPVDGSGPLAHGMSLRATAAVPPPAIARARLGPRLDLGVRVMNLFTPCRQGQRLGLFAGSGIGKSTLLAMLARHTACDVIVVALVGERGREVREFLEDDLGDAGRARAVTVVATSDALPLMRRQAALAAMTIAEHFRDEGRSVLLLMDSVTRYCLALREIALAAGEPPATRGYPPSVFAELPRLLERAGPGQEVDGRVGFITALFTVLVEGDDHNEPVTDAVRGILDGHVILDRRIAEAGRYPAVDVLRSLSRAAPGCNSAAENALVRRARAVLALHGEMADMVRLGAYRAGSDPAVDEAIWLGPAVERLLVQDRDSGSAMAGDYRALGQALGDAGWDDVSGDAGRLREASDVT